ncbi:MAG: hypothetical protein QW146_07135 [Candidatus Bathyarchaeia archaeon]
MSSFVSSLKTVRYEYVEDSIVNLYDNLTQDVFDVFVRLKEKLGGCRMKVIGINP